MPFQILKLIIIVKGNINKNHKNCLDKKDYNLYLTDLEIKF